MKILSAETNLGSATSVSNAPVVRLFNSGSSNILVTRKDYSGTVVGSFMVLSGDVVYCEKYFTDTLEGSADVKATKIGYSSMMSFASSGGGGSSSPTYTHSVSASSVDEGGSFTTTITTTNVADGTNLYWELSGTNITSADFSSGALTGTASISSNSATFSHTVAEDTLTEGTETVTIKVYSDSGRNTQVGNTLTVTLADTSTTPLGDYSVSFSNAALTIPDNDGWSLGQTFTIEAFIKGSAFGGYSTIVSQSDGGDNWYMSVLSNGKLQFYDFSGGENRESAAGAISLNTWHHVAFVGNSGTGTWYVDGTASGTPASIDVAGGTSGLKIGRQNNHNYDWSGLISNLRITKGQAIYTSNFTKPSSALTLTSQGATSSNVVLLCCNKSTPTGSTKTPGTISTEDNPTSSTDDPFSAPANWSNDGTTWSNLLSVPGDSFDISPTKAFDTTRQTAQQGDAARTAGNAPMVIFDLSGSNAQTVTSSIYVQAITGYSSWIEITVDGTTYTQTPSNGLYTWTIAGELTKIRIQNDNPNGRTYLEGIKLDGTWMTDNTVD